VDHRVRGFLSVGAAAVLWGVMGTAVVRLQGLGYDVWSISATRAGIGLLCALGALLVARPAALRFSRTDLAVFATAGLSGMVGLAGFYFLSIRQLGVGPAALLFYTKPLFVVPLAAIFLREPLTRNKALALLLGLAGVALVVKATSFQVEGGPNAWLGIAAGIAAGVSGAIFAVCNRYSAQRHPGAVANSMNLLFGSAFLWIIEAPRLASGAVRYHATALPWMVAMGVLFSFLPYAFYLRGLRDVGAGEANVVALLEPITAVITGVALFGERLSVQQGIGVSLVLLGAVLVAIGPEKPKRREANAQSLWSPTSDPLGSGGGVLRRWIKACFGR
jgi:drug/metabolite transporter, DME family